MSLIMNVDDLSIHSEQWESHEDDLNHYWNIDSFKNIRLHSNFRLACETHEDDLNHHWKVDSNNNIRLYSLANRTSAETHFWSKRSNCGNQLRNIC